MKMQTQQAVLDFGQNNDATAQVAQPGALQRLPLVLSLPKTKRVPELLADFRDGFASGWAMAVGEFFRDALDIKQTNSSAFSQGSQFAFSPGDTLYDTPEAYRRWDVALPRIRTCFQVREARPATPEEQIVRLGRNPSFKGSLEKRRLHVTENVPQELTLWSEVRKKVRDATNKEPSDTLLEKLVVLGALKKEVQLVPRMPGKVVFDILRPDMRSATLAVTCRKTVTQDEFVRLLIEGFSEPA